MQPSRTRLVCRAHNRFTPSIALWQHFVAPSRPLAHQLRQSSSAPEPVQHGADSNTPLPKVEGGEPKTAATSRTTPQPKQRPLIRKPTTVKGQFHASKVDASKAKNKIAQYAKNEETLVVSDKLLAAAKTAYEAAEDYEGVVVPSMRADRAIKESELPWASLKGHGRDLDGMDRLNLEIHKFYEYASPNRFEKVARKNLVEQVRGHVKRTHPNHILSPFGSEKTGIALALSDIDLRLTKTEWVEGNERPQFPPEPPRRKEAAQVLMNLHWTSMRKNPAYLLAHVRHARYPLISMQDRASGLDVQIVLNNDTSVSRVIMHSYMEEYPYLRPVYFVIKTLFLVRGLTDVFRGGFGSYSLFMMLVASIKHRPHPRNDAAGALVNFLDFWRSFDTTKQGISIEPAYIFDKGKESVIPDKPKVQIEKGEIKPLPPYMLTLRDPADETNNLGRKGIAIRHVQATLADIHKTLQHSMRVNTRHSLLAHAVGQSYMLDLQRRQKLTECGKKVMLKLQDTLAQKAKAIRNAEMADVGAGASVGETVQMDAGEEQAQDAAEKEKEQLAKEERDMQWQRLEEVRKQHVRSEEQSDSVGEALGLSPDEARNDDVKEDVAREDGVKEEVVKEEVVKEEVVKEDHAKEDVSKKDVGKEDVAKDDVAKEDVAKEDVAKEDVVKVDDEKKE